MKKKKYPGKKEGIKRGEGEHYITISREEVSRLARREDKGKDKKVAQWKEKRGFCEGPGKHAETSI